MWHIHTNGSRHLVDSCHTHMNQSSHTHEWVMSYRCMSRSGEIPEGLRSNTSTSHVSYEWVMSHMNESCLIWMCHVSYEWVISHLNGSCLIWRSHVAYTDAFRRDPKGPTVRHLDSMKTQRGVLQCVAVAVCCSQTPWQYEDPTGCVAVCCSVCCSQTPRQYEDPTRCLALSCTVLHCVLQFNTLTAWRPNRVCCSVLQCVLQLNTSTVWNSNRVCCSVLQYAAVCVAVCCMKSDTGKHLNSMKTRHVGLRCVVLCCSVLYCVAVIEQSRHTHEWLIRCLHT